ncbi:MAG TPA: FAD-dependent oxidoreductase [Firmicutes bacterium]|nr:FAD-dependent oxidoreductase [Bacillota bacterium]
MLTPEVMVVGAGPAGMAAALAAADCGADVLLCDFFSQPGGQLVKQTHKFFGSRQQFAGTRGIEIAQLLGQKVASHSHIRLLLDTQVLGYYPDGVLTMESAPDGNPRYLKARPRRLVVCAGASERPLAFPGNDLPGVYGAGAVQTLMNVHGVMPGQRAVMVGAGNIGLIISYQLRQAGVDVAAVVEAAPSIGGYAVHAAKIRRLGIPIYVSHSVKQAHGDRQLEGVTVWRVDERWQGIPGTEMHFEADVLCLAVGLSPLAEILWQAGCRMHYIPELGGHVPWHDETQQTSVPGIFVAGDTAGVEEASSAMVSGRIAGLAAAASLGKCPRFRTVLAEAIAELAALRAGPTGEKIRRGLHRLQEVSQAC